MESLACISDAAVGGCEEGIGLAGAVGVDVSPDGRHAYVASLHGGGKRASTAGIGGAIAVLAREGEGFRQVQCLTEAALEGCDRVAGLGATRDTLVEPDGRHVYAVALDGETGGGGLVVFDRDPETGRLAQVECFADGGSQSCKSTAGLDGAMQLALHPNTQSLYVASQLGGAEGAVSAYARDSSSGRLSFVNCVASSATADCSEGSGLTHARGVAVSPDGRHLYVATITGGAGGSIVAFELRPDGAIGSQVQCISGSGQSGCEQQPGIINPTQTVLTSDGRALYASVFQGDGGGGVYSFERNPESGELSFLGCVTEDATARCRAGDGIGGATAIALSRDERKLVVDSNHGGAEGAVAVLARDPTDNDLTPMDCVSSTGIRGCRPGVGLASAEGVAVDTTGTGYIFAATLNGGAGGAAALLRVEGSIGSGDSGQQEHVAPTGDSGVKEDGGASGPLDDAPRLPSTGGGLAPRVGVVLLALGAAFAQRRRTRRSAEARRQ